MNESYKYNNRSAKYTSRKLWSPRSGSNYHFSFYIKKDAFSDCNSVKKLQYWKKNLLGTFGAKFRAVRRTFRWMKISSLLISIVCLHPWKARCRLFFSRTFVFSAFFILVNIRLACITSCFCAQIDFEHPSSPKLERYALDAKDQQIFASAKRSLIRR